MKISQLVNAFRQLAGRSEAADAPPNTSARPAPPAESQSDIDGDKISISPQAVFLFAASQYDPRRITDQETGALAETLRDGRAITERDAAVLIAERRRRAAAAFDTQPGERRDLIAAFQTHLSRDTTNGNVAAVESDTRALSILGRLATLRDELLNGDET